jgi:hypothetical protein
MIGGEVYLSDQRYEITITHIFETQPESTEGPGAASELTFDRYSDNEYSSGNGGDPLLFQHDTLSSSSD